MGLFEDFFDVVAGSSLGFHVDFADILSDDAHAHQDNASHKPDGEDQGGPSGHGAALNHGTDDINQDAERDEHENRPEHGDAAQRLDAEGCDAVGGEV